MVSHPSDQVRPDFDRPDLAAAMTGLDPALRRSLPYRAIRLGWDQVGRLLAGEDVVLPECGTVLCRTALLKMVPGLEDSRTRQRLRAALVAARLDLAFDQVVERHGQPSEMRVRVQSVPDGGCWIFARQDA